MFTDWTMQDPRYFYARGVIYGVVLATMFWKVFVPWLCERFRKPNICLTCVGLLPGVRLKLLLGGVPAA